MKFKYCVYIGRFEPFTKAHLQILRQALEQADKVVLVIGSHNKARNIKNPWTSEERKEMVLACLSEEESNRIKFVYMKDVLYNDFTWISNLQNGIAEATENAKDEDIALIGFKSDGSGYYLSLFPKWQYISCPTDYNFHATDARRLFFTHDLNWKQCVPSCVVKYLEGFKTTEEFAVLKEEFDYIAEYKEQWRGAPFQPLFVCVDALVRKSGYLLLVRRKSKVGKGLLALPGGFVKATETLEDAVLRELKDETSIKLSKDELRKNIASCKVFDAVGRSNRSRVLSHSYFIDLGSGPLPPVKGNTDLDKAFWLPINDVLNREGEFFEDHYHITTYFCSRS